MLSKLELSIGAPPPEGWRWVVAEYAARYVKKAIVGSGAADKAQIAYMVERILPPARGAVLDAADALAVAITHAHARKARSIGAAA